MKKKRSNGFLLLAHFESTKRPPFQIPLPRFLYRFLTVFAILGVLFTSFSLFGALGFAIHEAALIREDLKSRLYQGETDYLRRQTIELSRKMESVFRFDDNIRLLYGLPSVHKDIREVGVGGPDLGNRDSLIRLKPRLYETRDLKFQISKLLRQTELEIATIQETEGEVRTAGQKLRSFPAVLPVFGEITSGFGFRFHPIEKGWLNHDGLDIASARWTPIYATADGVVSLCDYVEGYGNLVFLNHGYGFNTLYGHLQAFAVKKNQFVARGDLVGYMGNTGKSTGPHLHYEIRKNNKACDPLEYIYPVTPFME